MVTDDSPPPGDSFLAAMRLADSFLPVGGYTASYGIEQYINEGEVTDAADLEALVEGYLRRLVGPGELVALANAHGASEDGDLDRLLTVDGRLHAAMLPAEFRESSTTAGARLCDLASETGGFGGEDGVRTAFADAVDDGETPGHYAVALGVATASTDIERLQACQLLGYSFVSDVLGAAQRLGRFGHTDVQGVLADLQPVVAEVSAAHVDDDIEELRSFAPLAEVMGMRHEDADRRLFVS